MKLNKTKVLLAMAELEFTQADLASAAGITRQTVHAMMNGRGCRPNILGKVAKALNKKPEEIIE